MEDEFKRNDNKMINFIKNKDIYQKEYDDSLKKCIELIHIKKKIMKKIKFLIINWIF